MGTCVPHCQVSKCTLHVTLYPRPLCSPSQSSPLFVCVLPRVCALRFYGLLGPGCEGCEVIGLTGSEVAKTHVGLYFRIWCLRALLVSLFSFIEFPRNLSSVDCSLLCVHSLDASELPFPRLVSGFHL